MQKRLHEDRGRNLSYTATNPGVAKNWERLERIDLRVFRGSKALTTYWFWTSSFPHCERNTFQTRKQKTKQGCFKALHLWYFVKETNTQPIPFLPSFMSKCTSWNWAKIELDATSNPSSPLWSQTHVYFFYSESAFKCPKLWLCLQMSVYVPGSFTSWCLSQSGDGWPWKLALSLVATRAAVLKASSIPSGRCELMRLRDGLQPSVTGSSCYLWKSSEVAPVLS